MTDFFDSRKYIITRNEYANGKETFHVRMGTSFNRTSQLWEKYVMMTFCDNIESARAYRDKLEGMELVKEEVVE